MANHPKFDMTGIRFAQVGILDTNGIPMGAVGALANGDDTAMYDIDGLKTAGLNYGQPELVNIVGGGRFLSAYLFPPGEAPTGELTGAIHDMDLAVALDGTKKVTKGAVTMHLMGAPEAEYRDAAAIFQGHAKSKTTGYRGKGIWWGYIVPKVQMAFLGMTEMTQRAEVNARIWLAVSESDAYPWGEVFTVADEGGTGALLIPFTAEYPLTMHTLVGDGVTATFTLGKTPAGSDTASPQRVHVYDATNYAWLTTTTNFTVNVGAGTITFITTAIPAAGEVYVVFYEYVP